MAKKKDSEEELPLFAFDRAMAQAKEEKGPATAVMRAVAERTLDYRRMKKDFTPQEIEDIIFKRQEGDELTKEETRALCERYRKMKRWALEKEKTNRTQIIFVPCIIDNRGFYKLFEILARGWCLCGADRVFEVVKSLEFLGEVCYNGGVISRHKVRSTV